MSEVLTLYQQVVDRVNASLASFETLKRIHVVADEWTIDSGEMTPSMKLKRPSWCSGMQRRLTASTWKTFRYAGNDKAGCSTCAASHSSPPSPTYNLEIQTKLPIEIVIQGESIMRVGILTGGGDCPGLNAVIRAAVRKGIFHYGDEFIGFMEGWRGVLEDKTMPLTIESVSGILQLGGTILRTSRTNVRKKPGGIEQCIATIQRNKLDALITIGGDDTQGVANALIREGCSLRRRSQDDR